MKTDHYCIVIKTITRFKQNSPKQIRNEIQFCLDHIFTITSAPAVP